MYLRQWRTSIQTVLVKLLVHCHKPKYFVLESNASDKDQVDQAQFYCAVEGVTALTGASLGYLVAQYDVEFFTPA
jgi:hypothetical protein